MEQYLRMREWLRGVGSSYVGGEFRTLARVHVEVMNLAASLPLCITSVLTLVSSTGLASPASAKTGLATFRGWHRGVSGGRCCIEPLTVECWMWPRGFGGRCGVRFAGLEL